MNKSKLAIILGFILILIGWFLIATVCPSKDIVHSSEDTYYWRSLMVYKTIAYGSILIGGLVSGGGIILTASKKFYRWLKTKIENEIIEIVKEDMKEQSKDD